jgi:hypothetical protein
MVCLWKTIAGKPSAKVFPQIPNMCGLLSTGMLNSQSGHEPERSGPREQAAPETRAGYHPPVCSKTGDAIDRIAAAIDQLASDSRDAGGKASGDELTTRIAILWQMISDLDPELARRARKYTGLADGGPSA